ncbi:MAG TPA: superoxide dismutase [Cytophagaceae bacterium]|jgi:Fe-Mn family superoxide dismutase|nr:superoxide dismutase [Cytophagaceae bacterium]
MKKIFLLLGIVSFCGLSNAQAQFTVPPLPYSYNALEPSIDEQTMTIHHDKHHAAYVKNLNDAVTADSSLKNISVETLCRNVSKYKMSVRNNAGGHYNHSFFWTIMSPKSAGPSGLLLEDIIKTFGSLDKFKAQFSDSAKTRFGSGWAWLVVTPSSELKISTTPNQDNPLMDIVKVKGAPILALDVWEHAYYLKYQNKRPDYISAFWNVVNWEEVNRLYMETKKGVLEKKK